MPRQPLPVPARRAVTAETIAKALDGRKAGGCWMARCLAHDDRKPSLSITDSQHGKVLVRCHAGCDQDELIAALRMRGMWGTADRRGGRSRRENGRCPAFERDPDVLTRTQAALAIWQASQPAEGNAGRNLPTLPRAASFAAARHPLSCRVEASLGWRLAGDGGAGDTGRRRCTPRAP